MVGKIKIMVFWVMLPSCLVDEYQHFGETFCFHIQCTVIESSVHLNIGIYLASLIASHPQPLIIKFKTATEEPTNLCTMWKLTQFVISLGIKDSYFSLLGGFSVSLLDSTSVLRDSWFVFNSGAYFDRCKASLDKSWNSLLVEVSDPVAS